MHAMHRNFAAACLVFLATATASAQVLPSGTKKLPAAKAVLDLLGSPMSKMFDTFGPPDEVTPRGKTNPWVRADYGDFAFSIQNKKVIECYVWQDLPGDSGLGFNFGDALADATKKLGNPKQTVTNADGGGEADWNVPDKNRVLEMIFGPEKKCIGFAVLKGG
jgi:hypothetical protein